MQYGQGLREWWILARYVDKGMNLDKVFIVPFHVKRDRESIIPADVAGAYVSCYTAADRYELAVKKCLSALRADGVLVEEILQPINTMSLEDWSKHVVDEWPDQADQMPSQEEFEDALRGGNVVYGPFGSY